MKGLDKWHFQPHFHVECLDDERVLLFSEDQHYLLRGKIHRKIASIFLNSSVDESTLFANLSTNFRHEDIKKAFLNLKEKGFIAKHIENVPVNVAGFWAGMNFPLTRIKRSRVTLINFSDHKNDDLIGEFSDIEFSSNDDANFFLVLTENYISKDIENFNTERLKDNKPWMLVKPSGKRVWIGPIFEPQKTGCWNCLAERMKENRRVEVDAFGVDNENLYIPEKSYLLASRRIAFNLASIEVEKWLRSSDSHILCSNLFTFDLESLETHLHPFKRLTYCKICQQGNTIFEQRPLILKSCIKKYEYENGERACSVDATLNNLGNIVSPITGVISTVRTKIVNDEYICYTVRNLPVPVTTDTDRLFRIPDVATGKGKTKTQAFMGCLGEAIERYNSTFTKQLEIRSSYSSIMDCAIHPHELLNFSEHQYDNRDQINACRDGFNQIPKRYEDTNIGWTPVYSLIDKNFKYVPSSFCYMSYPIMQDVEVCPGNSNGCASGNTLEEAIFYGLLELIERDAVAIWWYNRIRRPCIDLNSFEASLFLQTVNTFKKNNRELYVLDLTSDLQIPSYIAISCDAKGKNIFFGTGSHFNSRIGVARALSELNQIMVRSNIPDNIDLMKIPPLERDLLKWSLTQSIDNHQYLIPYHMVKHPSATQVSDDFLDDINYCLSILKLAGLDVLILNLSNPDINLCSVRVIVPKLRHFWSRLGPGRLYEVPVKLGWLLGPTLEKDLNPTPYFL